MLILILITIVLSFFPKMRKLVGVLRELIFESGEDVREKLSFNVPFYRRHYMFFYLASLCSVGEVKDNRCATWFLSRLPLARWKWLSRQGDKKAGLHQNISFGERDWYSFDPFLYFWCLGGGWRTVQSQIAEEEVVFVK